MKKIKSTNTDNCSTPYYIRLETDAEGIRQYKSATEKAKQGTCLGQMRSEGILVPAILMEVDKETYEKHQHEVWKAEDKAKHEKRCMISGSNGKLIRCPIRVPNPDYDGSPRKPKTITNDCENCPYGYHHYFRHIKGNVAFSALDVEDENGNADPFEPESESDPLSADRYFELLESLISYIKAKYPKYTEYAEFVYLLGQEYKIKEVATIMKKSNKTLYGWRKKLRPIFDEYIQTIAH
ncbi:MAG: hypothetical protein K2O32_15875 [Acetatifactor sp.]|nr:hypothetical protein [Acetatifactor sp.]